MRFWEQLEVSRGDWVRTLSKENYSRLRRQAEIVRVGLILKEQELSF